MSSLGLINYIKISSGGTNIFDVIPVDIVSNGIIVATANAGTKPGNELDIYNCGSSVENPISLLKYRELILKVNKFFSFNKKIFPVYVEFIKNETEFLIKKKLFNEIPLKIAELTSKLPKIGNPQMIA
jgi:hypothetical protein